MKQLILFIFSASILSCNQPKNNSPEEKIVNEFSAFDKSNHLQPLFDKATFDSLHDWKFGWAILEPINIAKNQEDDKELSKRFSPGQKALYFIWYLDAEVTNGGFSQFYWNNYRKYLPPIIEGLKLIGDTLTLNLVNTADSVYLANKKDFPTHQRDGFNPPLIAEKDYFDKCDSIYYKIHNNMMDLIEKYARLHADDFVKFK